MRAKPHVVPRMLLRRTVVAVAALSTTLVVGGLVPVASAAGADRAGSVAVPATLATGPGPDESLDRLLDDPLNGSAAVEALGEDLDQVAAGQGWTARQLRETLESDDSLWVTEHGSLLWADSLLEESGAQAEIVGESSPGSSSRRMGAGSVSPLSVDDAFSLHTDPGADRVIFLDFDGASVADAWYDTGQGLPESPIPGWDPAGDGPEFSADELKMVHDVWAVIAERFAPWEVDVTTEEPDDEALVRVDEADDLFGVRVIVTPQAAWVPPVFGSVNGIALNTFGNFGSPTLSLVFPQSSWGAAGVANVAAHEVGHNLGLVHDTVLVTDDSGAEIHENFSGSLLHSIWKQIPGTDPFSVIGNWSPILGGLGTPLVQWDKGEYPGAEHTQDDLAVIGETFPVRADEAPGDAGSAVPLPASTAVITSESDVDSWDLGTCTSDATVTISPAELGPMLDVDASLVWRGEATPIATVNPATYYDWAVGPNNTSIFSFNGMGAALTVPAAGTGWVVQVRGGGNGDWADGGYGAYGSVGQYTIAVDGCDGVPVPGDPGAAPVEVPVSPEPVDGPAAALVSAPLLEGESNRVGATVSVAPITVSPTGATVTYQWRRSATTDGAFDGSADGAWVAIGGATGPTHVLTADDVGHRLSVLLTVRADGLRESWSTTPASSRVVGATEPDPSAFGAPTTGQFRVAWEPDDNQGTGPDDLAVDQAGYVYVPATLDRFSRSSTAGESDATWDVPLGRSRIQQFTAAGDLVGAWDVPGGRYAPYLAAIDVGPDGHVYALDSSNHRVFEYESDGTLVQRWSVPIASSMLLLRESGDLAVDDAGDVYVSDVPFGVVQKFAHDIGQDPYPNPGEAMGLAFSVPVGAKLPTSLRNIHHAMAQDGYKPPEHGDLTGWAKQGVLLLNLALTVPKGQAGEHLRRWRPFTKAVLKALNSHTKPVVFILWGAKAQEIKRWDVIDFGRHGLVEAPHPAARKEQPDFRTAKTFAKRFRR